MEVVSQHNAKLMQNVLSGIQRERYVDTRYMIDPNHEDFDKPIKKVL